MRRLLAVAGLSLLLGSCSTIPVPICLPGQTWCPARGTCIAEGSPCLEPEPVDCRTAGCSSGYECRQVGTEWRCVDVDPCDPFPCDEHETCVPTTKATAYAAAASCKPPQPVCEINQTCGCWHRPPGESWQRLPDCPEPEPKCDREKGENCDNRTA